MLPKFYVTIQIEGASRLPIIADTLADWGYEPEEGTGADGRPMLTAAETLILPADTSLIQYTDRLAADVWRANRGPCVVRVLPMIIQATSELVRGPVEYDRYRAATVLTFDDEDEDEEPEGSA